MRILVVDDEKSLRIALADELSEAGYEVRPAESGEAALALLEADPYDLVITDLMMDKISGLDLISYVNKRGDGPEILVMTAYGTVESAVEALKKGALDYICKPFEIDNLLHIVSTAKRTIRLKRENEELKSKLEERHSFQKIIGKSPSMQSLFSMLESVSDSGATILIQGETGTGKELVAEAIHYSSSRKHRPFLPVSCAALSRDLLESELFGHEQGAFTGAIKQKKGRFELAHEGTLFLDEIDDTPAETQVKLLRAIQSGKFERVGGENPIQVNVRIICATKHNLADLVEAGKFRRDLFYRLNVIPVILPPLRDRKEDIPLLVAHFLEQFAPGKKITVAPEIMEQLLNYDWDGNIRELEHTIERLVLLTKEGEIDRNALPPKIRDFAPEQFRFDAGRISLPEYLDRIEHRILVETLRQLMGSKTRTAEMLGIPLPTLKSKLKKFQIGRAA
jgi:DNA-binding NtrC family response regulator